MSGMQTQGTFYVVDTVTSHADKRVVSGPFTSWREAEDNRVQWNIAGDLVVARRVGETRLEQCDEDGGC